MACSSSAHRSWQCSSCQGRWDGSSVGFPERLVSSSLLIWTTCGSLSRCYRRIRFRGACLILSAATDLKILMCQISFRICFSIACKKSLDLDEKFQEKKMGISEKKEKNLPLSTRNVLHLTRMPGVLFCPSLSSVEPYLCCLQQKGAADKKHAQFVA